MRQRILAFVPLVLLACTACSRASDARRDHVLAGPHGWVDLVAHAPAPLAYGTRCVLEFGINGETLLAEGAPLAQADAASSPMGWRFATPAGTLATDLVIHGCTPQPLHVQLPVKLDADHLARLEFDGHQLVQKSIEPWAPTTLDAVSAQLATLQDGGHATEGQVASLSRWMLAVLALNVAVLGVVLVLVLRRRGQA